MGRGGEGMRRTVLIMMTAEMKWVMRLMGNPGRCQGPVERRWEIAVGLKDWDLGSWERELERPGVEVREQIMGLTHAGTALNQVRDPVCDCGRVVRARRERRQDPWRGGVLETAIGCRRNPLPRWILKLLRLYLREHKSGARWWRSGAMAGMRGGWYVELGGEEVRKQEF